MSECLIVLERCQRAGEVRDYGFNWTQFLANRWSKDTPFATGDRVRPSTLDKQNGFEYVASGGQSNGKKEPAWPRPPAIETAGATHDDGSLVWTAAALSFASLNERVDTSTWIPPADGPTVVDDTVTDSPGQQQTACLVTGGAVGQTYDIVNEIVTTDGREYHGILRLTII